MKKLEGRACVAVRKEVGICYNLSSCLIKMSLQCTSCYLGNVCHDGVMVVGRERVVPTDGDHRLGGVVGTLLRGGAGTRGVRVLRLLHVTPQLQVVEPQLSH
jgi:hypothetical protein